MNHAPPAGTPVRFRWECAALLGLTLALVAMWLWVAAGGSRRVIVSWLACGGLVAAGVALARPSGAVQLYSHLLVAGGLAGFFGSVCAGYGQDPPSLFHAWWLAWPLLAVGAIALAGFARAFSSVWLGVAGFALALLGVTLPQFTVFSLAAHALLLALAALFFHRHGWSVAAWVALIGFPLAFLLGWPFSEGRLDTDRYLELSEYFWTLAFFAAAWLVLLHIATQSAESAFTPRRRLLFATLNNALFYLVGVLILPPRFPAWFWRFTIAAGLLFLAARMLTGRFPALRRAFAIHGSLLVALGIASSVIGPQPAAIFAVVSAFFVLSVEQPDQRVLRFCAGLAAVLAVLFAVEPIFGSSVLRRALNIHMGGNVPGTLLGNRPPSLWLGVFTGAPLVFASIWISRHRERWPHWAVLFFGGLGLGTWLLTTLAQAPAAHYPPILSLEAVIVTASILVLGIREYPWLAASVLLLAQFLWFQQVGNFNARPWWNPLVVVLCTLGLSAWWQTRGRALFDPRALRWLQGIAAAAAVAILLLSIETASGRSAIALVALSLIAVALVAWAWFLRDWLLLGFAQLIVATAVGEFFGQLSSAPLPRWIAPLLPIAMLLVLAPMLPRPVAGSVWETPAHRVAMLYRVLAAMMFVVWVLHYIPAASRFVFLALAAVALLLLHIARHPRGPLPGSIVCALGAVAAFWMTWGGVHGFRLRDLLAFLLLLMFGQLLRRKNLLPDELQSIGIVLGLAAVTQWVENWCHFHHPALPTSVVWATVAAIVVCAGWWFHERLFRLLGWVLLLAALGRVVWMDLIESHLPPGTDPAFRLGLLAVGIAALVAASTYARFSRASSAARS